MKYTIKEYPHLKQKVEKMSTDELLKSVICPNISVGEDIPEINAHVR